jgi:hypothetical protein
MGAYFKGRIISNESIVQRLSTNSPQAEHVGSRIWVWKNPKTGRTIITGDEGNGWSVILAEGNDEEETMAKFKANQENNEVFTELSQRIMEKILGAA